MSVIAKIQLDSGLLSDFFLCYQCILSESGELLVGEDEESEQTALTFDELISICKHKVSTREGFYVANDDLQLSISIDQPCAAIFCESEDASVIDRLMSEISDLSVDYAFACTPEEREHQNKLKATQPYGIHEGWVGRNFKKYLPGLYWINIWPKALYQAYGLTLQDLPRFGNLQVEEYSDNFLVKIYCQADEWEEWKDENDQWRESKSSVFFKDKVEDKFIESANFMEASSIIAEWD